MPPLGKRRPRPYPQQITKPPVVLDDSGGFGLFWFLSAGAVLHRFLARFTFGFALALGVEADAAGLFHKEERLIVRKSIADYSCFVNDSSLFPRVLK